MKDITAYKPKQITSITRAFSALINDIFPDVIFKRDKSQVIITLKLIGRRRTKNIWHISIGNEEPFCKDISLCQIVEELIAKVQSTGSIELMKGMTLQYKHHQTASKNPNRFCDYNEYIPRALQHIKSKFKYKITTSDIEELSGLGHDRVKRLFWNVHQGIKASWNIANIELVANIFDCSAVDVLHLAQTLSAIDKEKGKQC